MFSRVPPHGLLHRDYGCLRVGRSYWYAGGTLAIYADSLVVSRESLFYSSYVLPRISVSLLHQDPQLFWFMFSGGLRITHTVASYPEFLYYSHDIEVLIVKLQQNDFPVITSDT